MTPSSRRAFPNASRAFSMIAGRSASGLSWMKLTGRGTSAASNRCPTISNEPLALRYHGHQFRVYNPEIGDGRGFTFAQLRDRHDRLLDLGTKGSGQTPYSRHADGRLTLKGGVREVLATEMLEALGVNTSKSFALFETGEALERGDEPSPTRSSVLTRLSHGHIRIGTFQRLAFFGRGRNIKKLARYCLENLYSEQPASDDAENALRLFDLVEQRNGGPCGFLSRRGLRPWRAQQRQYQRHRRELRLWAVAVHALLGPRIHRCLFRPLRPLCLRPAARSDPLGPRPARRLPVADRRCVRPCPTCSRNGAAGSKKRWSTRCSGAWASQRAKNDRELAGCIDQSARNACADDRPHLLRLARRPRSGRGRLSRRCVPRARQAARGARRRRNRILTGRESEPCSMHIEEVEAIWSAIAERDDWQPFNNKVKAIRRWANAMEQDAPAS